MTEETGQDVAKFQPTRLPWHPEIAERFGALGVSKATWKALCEGVFPLAQSTDSIVLALSYCAARKLDPFKKVVHIVPVWNSKLGKLVDTVWPGIAEHRITAFRTKSFAGKDAAVWGPDVEERLGTADVTYPEWCQITLYRMVLNARCAFVGPKVYWKETYAQKKKDDVTPNAMWMQRPRGQLEKCAMAAALREAFPEETGGEITAEEIEGKELVDVTPPAERVYTGEAPEEKPKRSDFQEKEELLLLVDQTGEEIGHYGPATWADEFMTMYQGADGRAKLDQAGRSKLWDANEESLHYLEQNHAEGCYGPIVEFTQWVDSRPQKANAEPPQEKGGADPSPQQPAAAGESKPRQLRVFFGTSDWEEVPGLESWAKKMKAAIAGKPNEQALSEFWTLNQANMMEIQQMPGGAELVVNVTQEYRASMEEFAAAADS